MKSPIKMKMGFVMLMIAVLVIGYRAGFAGEVESRIGSTGQSFDVPEAVSFESVLERVPVPDHVVTAIEEAAEEAPSLEEIAEEREQLAEVNLAVPFTPQAPFANWDHTHQETCEEASLLMVHAFYEGQEAGLMDPDAADEALLAMVEREEELFGYFEDTTVAETITLAEDVYGYTEFETLENPTIDELKAHLAAGRPIIVPMSGRILSNPFFSGDGPLYHMVVLKGYTADGFITNDPGTRRGADWIYPYDHVLQSIHDWVVPEGIENTPDEIPETAKRAFVIYP